MRVDVLFFVSNKFISNNSEVGSPVANCSGMRTVLKTTPVVWAARRHSTTTAKNH
jgi:hypothetical protein